MNDVFLQKGGAASWRNSCLTEKSVKRTMTYLLLYIRNLVLYVHHLCGTSFLLVVAILLNVKLIDTYWQVEKIGSLTAWKLSLIFQSWWMEAMYRVL